MQFLDLWAPILLSAVLCFIASALIWMVLPFHKHDYKAMPREKEDALMQAVKSAGLSPGQYCYPMCKPGDEKRDPALAARINAGPWGMLTVTAGKPEMGRMLGLWFVNLVLLSAMIAYICAHGLKPAAPYLHTFRIAGSVALLAYAGGALTRSIWEGKPWGTIPGQIVDGVVYACLTAGAFAWWIHRMPA
jgi:hypothetical protein